MPAGAQPPAPGRSVPAPVRRRLRREDRERQLLEVAEAVFAEQGFRASGMDEIARRAGITKPVLYDHFGSKEGLLAACIAKGRQDLYSATIAAAATSDDAREMLRGGIRAFFTFVAARGRTWSVLLQTAAISDVASRGLEQGRQQQAELTASLLGRAFPDMSDDRREIQANVINGACEQVAGWWGGRPDLDVDAVTDAVVSLLVPTVPR